MKNKIKYFVAVPLLSTMAIPCCIQMTSCSNDEITPFYKFKITYNDDSTATINGLQDDYSSLVRINIPSTFEDEGITYTVTTIAINAFSDNQKLKQVRIPKTITTIGNSAFARCRSLAKFEIESDSDLETFPLGALTEDSSLTSLDFSKCNKMKTIQGEFSSGLTSIVLPPFLESLESNLHPFSNCNRLSKIEIGNENEKFRTENNMLFQKDGDECKLLIAGVDIKNADVPEGTTEICFGAFKERPIETLKLPASLKTISDNSFELCEKLKTVNVANDSKLNSIGNYAFRQCISLESVTIPDDAPLSTIGAEAFYQNASLKNFNFKLKKLSIISWSAFDCCLELKKVELNNEQKVTFGQFAFSNCLNLTSFISRGELELTTSTNGVFDGCLNLNEIIINQDISTIYTKFSFNTRCTNGTFTTKNANNVKDKLVSINQNFKNWNFVEYYD